MKSMCSQFSSYLQLVVITEPSCLSAHQHPRWQKICSCSTNQHLQFSLLFRGTRQVLVIVLRGSSVELKHLNAPPFPPSTCLQLCLISPFSLQGFTVFFPLYHFVAQQPGRNTNQIWTSDVTGTSLDQTELNIPETWSKMGSDEKIV